MKYYHFLLLFAVFCFSRSKPISENIKVRDSEPASSWLTPINIEVDPTGLEVSDGREQVQKQMILTDEGLNEIPVGEKTSVSSKKKKNQKHRKRRNNKQINVEEGAELPVREIQGRRSQKQKVTGEIIPDEELQKYETSENSKQSLDNALDVLLKRGQNKKQKKKMNGYTEMSLDQIIEKLKSNDLTNAERRKLIHMTKILEDKMGPHPAEFYQRFRFQGRKLKVRLVRSNQEKSDFRKRVDAVIDFVLRWLKMPFKAIAKYFSNHKDESKSNKKEEGLSSASKLENKSSLPNDPDCPGGVCSLPPRIPKKDQQSSSKKDTGIKITKGQVEIQIEMEKRGVKKAMIYVYAADAEHNDELLKTVRRVYSLHNSKFPLFEVPRDTENLSAYKDFTGDDAVLYGRVIGESSIQNIHFQFQDKNWLDVDVSHYFKKFENEYDGENFTSTQSSTHNHS